jgi:hypothetical protein
VFCGPACRTAFHTAARRWAERAVAAGTLTVADIRKGRFAACTLLPGGNPPVSISEPRKPTLVVPTESPDPSTGSGQAGAAELLDEVLIALLDLPAEGWFTVIDMLPAGLVERLARGGHAVRKFARFSRPVV